MNLNKVVGAGRWVFYKTISVPSFLVGYGLRFYKWIGRDETINQSAYESRL